MQKNNNNKIVLTLLLTALGTTGCASMGQFASNTSAAANDQSAGASAEEVLYDIKTGDTLALISKRLTGQLENWRIIAEHNQISNPGNISAGDTLRIPTKLLQSTQVAPIQVAASTTVSPTVTTGTGVSVVRSQASLPDVNANIKVSAVDINRSFSLLPLGSVEVRRVPRTQTQTQRQVQANPNVAAPKVRVTGTYFPKGIYKQPADYAPLLQRVTPGSVFELEYKIGDWFKVKTDKGDGYIRYSDVTLLP